MANDHANAVHFARLLSGIPGVTVDPDDIETNIVFFDVGGAGFTALGMVDALKARGVRTLYDEIALIAQVLKAEL